MLNVNFMIFGMSFFSCLSMANQDAVRVFDSFLFLNYHTQNEELSQSPSYLQYQSLTSFGFKESVFCGPGSQMNSFSCGDFHGKKRSFSIPGRLSLQPFYYQNSWLIGTSEGFLIRWKTQSTSSVHKDGNNYFPKMSNSLPFLFQTTEAREKQRDIYENTQKGALSSFNEEDWNWVLASKAKPLGEPLITSMRDHENNIHHVAFVYFSDGFLKCIDYEKGTILWSLPLYQDSAPVVGFPKFLMNDNRSMLIVAGSRSEMRGLEPATGKVLWTHSLAQDLKAGSEILVEPLFLGKRLLVSLREEQTVLLDLEACLKGSCRVLWSLPSGATAPLVEKQGFVFLGTSKGSLLKVRLTDGALMEDIKVASYPLFHFTVSENLQNFIFWGPFGEMTSFSMEKKQVAFIKSYQGLVRDFYSFPYHKSTLKNQVRTCLSMAGNSLKCFDYKVNF